jgi:ankyrin repeat protein/TPR repeat protein
MQYLIFGIVRLVNSLFICVCLLILAGCSGSPSIPEGFDVPGWMNAIAAGESAAVKAGLELGVPATTRRADGLTALQVAVRNGRLETARILIEAGADVNETGNETLSPLFLAIYRDDAGMVGLLLHSGARLEGRNRYAMEPLKLALVRQDIQVITELALADHTAEKQVRQWLKEQETQVDISGEQVGKFLCLQGILALAEAKDPESALEAEKTLGSLADIQGEVGMEAAYTLLKAYSDTKSPFFNLYKAEHQIRDYYYSLNKTEAAFFAKRAASGSEPMAAFLYGRGLRTSSIGSDTPDHPGSKLILESARAGNIFAQADLGEKYEDYFPEASHEEAAREKFAWLQKAAEAGLSEAAYNLAYMYVHDHWTARDLKKALFWFNRTGELGGCYVYRRIGYNFREGNENFPVDLKKAVEWYRKGAACGDIDAMTRLAEAYEEGKLGLAADTLQAAKYYIQNPDRQENAFALASKGLPQAIQENNADLVGQWLALLPSTSPPFLDGWLAVAEYNHPVLAGKFLEAGVDVNGSIRDQTALMVASLQGHKEMTGWLLENGSDVNRKNAVGGTPLSLAAGQGRLDLVQLLLEKGASLEGAAGSPSPLIQAVRGGHHEMVRLLLDKGAEMPEIGTDGGQSLFAFVRRKGDLKMERLLLEAQPANVSLAEKETAFKELAQRDATALRKKQWLAGKLIVRLDDRGKPLSAQDGAYESGPWRCITDEMSGLSWLARDDSGGSHDKDMLFSLPGGTASECRIDHCDLLAYREKVRADTLCGFSDWRVPTVNELSSLAYPHMAASFPFWPGFVQWIREDTGEGLLLTHASGLLGRTTGIIAFDAIGQVMLVRGRLLQLPEEAVTDFTMIKVE